MPDHTEAEIEARFWKELRSDMTVMLGLPGRIAPRPMTAQFTSDAADDSQGPIWFFTSRDTEIGAAAGARPQPAELTFAAKGHGTFATVAGQITLSNDRAVIDRLWNAFVAAWFEGGRDDPKLALLRFDPADAEIWVDGSSLLAGLRILLGRDPKQDYRDNVAKVRLR